MAEQTKDKKRVVKKDEMVEIIDHYEKKITYLYERIDELESQIKQHDKLFEEVVRITNKSEKDIDMLKRWRG